MTTSQSMTGPGMVVMDAEAAENRSWDRCEDENDRYDQSVTRRYACFQGIFEQYDQFTKNGPKGPVSSRVARGTGVPVTV